jgi:diguanylate cyclase (GGDEF)-like protein/PAS domain S-box-containing protein
MPKIDPDGPVRVAIVGTPGDLEASVWEISESIEVASLGPNPGLTAIREQASTVILVGLGRLNDAALERLRGFARVAPAVVAVADGDPAARGFLRDAAATAGAATLLLRSELTPALLAEAIEHARDRAILRADLAEYRDRFALAVEGADVGVWDWDLRSDHVFYSHRWAELLGLDPDKLLPTPETWLSRIHPDDRPLLDAALSEHLEGRTPVLQVEHRIRDGQGEWRWISVRGLAGRGANDKPWHMAGSMSDVTVQRTLQAGADDERRRDSVTGLPRRPVLVDRVEACLSPEDGEPIRFVLLMVQLDQLETIRRGLGPTGADALLAAAARRLEGCLRPSDMLVRMDGGEFAVLLEHLEHPADGARVAQRVHEALRDPFDVGPHSLLTTASIGMTTSVRGYTDPDEAVADAIAAKRRSKGEMGAAPAFDAQMRVEALAFLHLEQELHEAVERKEFELHYQPVIDYETRRLLGCEALLRWRHPTRGMVGPNEFIPVAEETGLILPMGRWAIRTATAQIRQWEDQFDLDDDFWVSINVSVRQAGDPQLVPALWAAIEDASLAPSRIKLELTESMLMADADAGVELLTKLRERGISIFVDDFGTGYSSLSYLHQFPIDGLKIDRTFVMDLDGTEESALMVRTIMSLAEQMNLKVVAEGVERKVQAEQLLGLGCRPQQGWLYAKALPSVDFAAMLAKGNILTDDAGTDAS